MRAPSSILNGPPHQGQVCPARVQRIHRSSGSANIQTKEDAMAAFALLTKLAPDEVRDPKFREEHGR